MDLAPLKNTHIIGLTGSIYFGISSVNIFEVAMLISDGFTTQQFPIKIKIVLVQYLLHVFVQVENW